MRVALYSRVSTTDQHPEIQAEVMNLLAGLFEALFAEVRDCECALMHSVDEGEPEDDSGAGQEDE